MTRRGRPGGGPTTAVVIALVSAVVVALQVVVMRALSVVSYHHFIYLVISIALLGFGASGTLLSILRERITAGFQKWSAASLAVFAVSTSWAYRLSVSVPVDMQYLLHSPREWAFLALIVAVLTVPFLSGGFFIGLVLTSRARSAGRLYAVNMIASGAGGVLGVGLLSLVHSAEAPSWLGLAALVGFVLWAIAASRDGANRARRLLVGVAVVICVGAGILVPARFRVDQYKSEAQALRLAAQGDAELIALREGPRSRISVYESRALHFALFASPLAPPPPDQAHVFVDGALAGPVFRIRDPEQAPILSELPQSVVYRLGRARKVLLLGETTGINVWLALHFGAESVTVVQTDPALIRVMSEDVAGIAGSVYARPQVEIVTDSPRSFLTRSPEMFDVIHIVEAESMPASGGGLASLREDYLLTVEGIGEALEHLRPSGMISVTRGLQSPPRDNIRILSLFAESARRTAGDPTRHLLQARNYLAATTILAQSPISEARIRQFRNVTERLLMDADYFPGITPEDLTFRNRLLTGSGEGSYYYQAAQAMAAGRLQEFSADWVYDLSPPTDDNPYFHSFFRLRHLGEFVSAYGGQWFARLELGSAVVAITLVIVLAFGLVLIVVPVIVARRRGIRDRANPGEAPDAIRRVWALAHFALIGLGFMFLEMLFIQKLTRYLGDPLVAATAVLTAVLTFAGLGSAVQGMIRLRPELRIAIGAGAAALLAPVYGPLVGVIMNGPVPDSQVVRFLIAAASAAPLSFVLGWQFPAGLEAISGDGSLLPISWATNGVTSVVAAPLAVIVSLGAGFSALAAIAAGCYGAVAVASLLLWAARSRHSTAGGPGGA